MCSRAQVEQSHQTDELATRVAGLKSENDRRQTHSDILTADLETAHEMATHLEVAIGEKQTALDEAIGQLTPTQNATAPGAT